MICMRLSHAQIPRVPHKPPTQSYCRASFSVVSTHSSRALLMFSSIKRKWQISDAQYGVCPLQD